MEIVGQILYFFCEKCPANSFFFLKTIFLINQIKKEKILNLHNLYILNLIYYYK